MVLVLVSRRRRTGGFRLQDGDCTMTWSSRNLNLEDGLTQSESGKLPVPQQTCRLQPSNFYPCIVRVHQARPTSGSAMIFLQHPYNICNPVNIKPCNKLPWDQSLQAAASEAETKAREVAGTQKATEVLKNPGLGLQVQRLGVWGLRFRVSGLGFRVWGFRV